MQVRSECCCWRGEESQNTDICWILTDVAVAVDVVDAAAAAAADVGDVGDVVATVILFLILKKTMKLLQLNVK